MCKMFDGNRLAELPLMCRFSRHDLCCFCVTLLVTDWSIWFGENNKKLKKTFNFMSLHILENSQNPVSEQLMVDMSVSKLIRSFSKA